MNRLCSLLLIFFSSSCFAQQATDYLERSRNIMDLFVRQEFGKIYELLDTGNANRPDTAKLRNSWEKSVKYGGAFVKVLELTADQQLSYDVVEVHCQFEKRKVKLKVVFDILQKIKGLYLVPDEAVEHYSPPPFFHADKIRERNKVVGNLSYRMPGTLTAPKAPGKYPAVVLIHGSGANDKDESAGPLKIFKDLASCLAEQGIVVLRYDKRNRVHGGKMAALKYRVTVNEETIEDALLAVQVLKADSSVDTNRIFLLGHSLGGYLLPRIAKQCPGLKGIILLAANSQPLEDVIAQQSAYLINMDSTYVRKKETLDSLNNQVALVKKLSEKDKDDSTMYFRLPVRYWLDLKEYDPIKTALQSEIPILILHGDRDYQVTLADYSRWTSGLKLRKKTTFKKYPNLNHFFIPGSGKSSLADYKIAGNVSKQVIDDIASWIKTGNLNSK